MIFIQICRSTHLRKLKFLGRRINHQWTESDSSLIWYKGTVLFVSSSKYGNPDSLYEVLYEGEDASYEVDSLIKTIYNKGTLTFLVFLWYTLLFY
jgi:hypothetical protein